MAAHPIISPDEIKRRVDDGEPVVIYNGYVLHLGEWINRHPGGKLAILHMVGRDATDEIDMYVFCAPALRHYLHDPGHAHSGNV